MAELLLYHSALGRGYESPFPATKGLVFTSALPAGALPRLMAAEVKFHRWHSDVIADDKKQLELLESQPKEVLATTGGLGQLKKLKETVSQLPHVTWKEEGSTKATIVELMKKSYYGSFTYVDQMGGRLAHALLHPTRLASDITFCTLTEGTNDEAFIRANATGGACIHSLTGRGVIFNYFSNCKQSQVERLMDRVKNSVGCQHGIGSMITLPGRPVAGLKVDVETLYNMLINVYARGAKDPEKRVIVKFKHGTEGKWAEFLEWGLKEMLEEDKLSEWQVEMSYKSPASVRNSVLFGARAAMTNAFLETTVMLKNAPFGELELTEKCLEEAKIFARLLYKQASGHETYTRRLDNLQPNHHNRITPHKLQVAKQAMLEAILNADDGKVSRRTAGRSIKGVTLGLLDELVRQGDLYELRGTDQCQMGRTTRAYVVPTDAPAMDVLESLDEFHDAEREFKEDPHGYDDREVLKVYESLQHKAERFNLLNYLPAVPLSQMSSHEIRMLPKLLSVYTKSLLLRGADREPEPPKLLKDGDLDAEGLNLWVRYKPGTSEEFYDWHVVGKLKLAEHWGEEEQPPVVPA